jgi:putative MFS transporter
MIGLTPLLLAVVSYRLAPESPRFLLAHGRRAEAESVLASIERRYGLRLELPEQRRARRRSNPFSSLAELWGPSLRRRTITLWLTWFVMVASYNGPFIWLPSILAGSGIDDARAARIALFAALWMIPASIVSVLSIDQLGRRRLLLPALGIATIGMLTLAFARSDLLVIVGGAGVAGGLLAGWPVILGYTAELYPTRMRATASGWAGAFARTGGIISPLLLGQLIRSWGSGLTLALSVFAALLALATLLVLFEGQETSGRALEELSS